MFRHRRSRLVRSALALAIGVVTFVSAGAPAQARIDDADLTVISDGTNVQGFSIAHNPEKNEYFAVWREFTEGPLMGVLLDRTGKIITGPIEVGEQRPIPTGEQLDGAGSWDPKVVYNAATDQYLALVQRIDTSPLLPAADRRNSASFGQLINDAGALVGDEVRLNRRDGVSSVCLNRFPDLVTNPSTGGYVLTYTRWYGTTSEVGNVCEGLAPNESTTVVQTLSASLARESTVDFPVINEGATSPRVGHNPVTDELLVTQPYEGSLRTAANDFGREYPVQRFDATTLAAVSGIVDVATGPELNGSSNMSEVIPTADPTTGAWFLVGRSGPFGAAWTNLLDSAGSSLRAGTVVAQGRPTAVAASGGGTFAMTTSSGAIVHVDSDGREIHVTMPFAGSNSLNPSAIAIGARSGVAIGYETASNVVGTTAVEVIAPGALPLAPARLLDTRGGDDAPTIDGEFEGGGQTPGGEFVELDVAGRGGVPDDAEAALLNIAAAGAPAGGFVTAYPCDADSRPTTSNLNYPAGGAASAAAIAKISTEGTVCVFTSSTAHLIVDVNGYVPGGGSVTPIVPARLLETRSGAGNETVDGASQAIGRVASESVTKLKVTDRGGVAADAAAVLVNVTAITPSTSTFLTIFPCGADQPTAANLNAPAGGVVNNLALAKVGDNGEICLFSSAETDLVVDVNAFVPAGGGLQSIVPARYYETRTGLTTVDGIQQGTGRLRADADVSIQISNRPPVPADATGVMLNVAAIRPDDAGFMTLYPCGTERPQAANLNFAAGAVVSNAVFVKLSTNQLACLYSSTGSDVAVDVIGYVVDS